ncbi:hypothetical protein FA95DRAFT_303814 [Auriscalpium vulgare]|uniref:Uncharacterized protein n=1 Tax=Auriscalpium vulgare TaxID=40419 RepID=A0ACB8RK03_9AGAM|nr:hypothetical protein FA95DRAFT_303814 [Auriscalpium vulgare]
MASIGSTRNNRSASELDLEYKRLRKALLRNRNERNALAYVARLPTEIITRILFLLMQATRDRRPSHLKLGWITATHVCERWRRVAIACPILWTEIRFDIGARWTHEMFTRAGKVPLVIHCTDRLLDSAASFQVDLLARRIHLAREIILSPRLVKLLSQPMRLNPFPYLEKFLVKPARTGAPHAREIYAMPKDFLGGHAPRLRCLNMVLTQVNWTAPVLSNLVQLEVLYPLHAPSRPACVDFLDALRRMSSLELLAVANLPLQTHAEPGHITDIVDMPRLRMLDLADALSPCIHLIGHLSLPRSTNLLLHLFASAEPFTPTTLRHLFSTINSRIQGSSAHISSLELGSEEPRVLLVDVARGPGGLDDRVSISVEWGEETEEDDLQWAVFDTVTTMCEAFREHLSFVSVDMQCLTWSVAAWWRIIQAASNVRALTVIGRGAADALCATLSIASGSASLPPELEAFGVPPPTPVDQYLSKLEGLKLVRAHLGNELAMVEGSLGGVPMLRIHGGKQFPGWLRRRNEASVPLLMLQLVRCDVSDVARELLEGVCREMVIA